MIFIDSGPFIARYLERDQYHEQATASWNKLRDSNRPSFTTNFVLDETVTLLARRAGYEFAAQRARTIYSSQILTIVRPSEGDEIEAIELLERYADQKVSFTDCVSFVLMRKHKLSLAFSFDSHFETAGFTLWP